jgi:hypothetical protein
VKAGKLTVSFRARKTCHFFRIYFWGIPILGIFVQPHPPCLGKPLRQAHRRRPVPTSSPAGEGLHPHEGYPPNVGKVSSSPRPASSWSSASSARSSASTPNPSAPPAAPRAPSATSNPRTKSPPRSRLPRRSQNPTRRGKASRVTSPASGLRSRRKESPSSQ